MPKLAGRTGTQERKVLKMLDKNGREIKMGDIVRVENGYFKSSNGLFFLKVNTEILCGL